MSSLAVSFTCSLCPVLFACYAFQIRAVIVFRVVVLMVNFFTSRAVHFPAGACSHLVFIFVPFPVSF